MNWQYTDATNKVAFCGTESCLVEAIADWVAAGNTPTPADLPTPPTYRELRAAAYPPVTDGLDAMVKGGQALEDYKAVCLAVKAKYPKV